MTTKTKLTVAYGEHEALQLAVIDAVNKLNDTLAKLLEHVVIKTFDVQTIRTTAGTWKAIITAVVEYLSDPVTTEAKAKVEIPMIGLVATKSGTKRIEECSRDELIDALVIVGRDYNSLLNIISSQHADPQQ
jgi:hypothetical protein